MSDTTNKKSYKLPKVTEVPSNAPNGRSVSRVINYDDYRRGTAINHRVDGYWFDQDQFENLIDMWNTQEDILTILQVSREELDIFCKAIYDCNFDKTYRILYAISKSLMRKSISSLAKQGNATALAAATKHFAGLKDDTDTKPVSIVIKNDLD